MANNEKKSVNKKKVNNNKKEVNNKKGNNSKKVVNNKNVNTQKSDVKKNSIDSEVKNKKEEIKVTKVSEVKKEEKVAEKKSFSLTSKQKDIILVLLVLVLLVVAVILTSPKKEKIDIELPAILSGEVGFTEITYEDYKEKVANNEIFMMVIVKDGCGYCEMYEPIVEEVANEYNLPFYYINLTNLSVEDSEELASTNKYLRKNIRWGTPTTLFMYGENVIDSISGYVEKDTFVEFVKENFKVEE